MRTIWIDLDEVVYKSISKFIEIFNKKYNINIDFKKVKKWDFSDVCKFQYEGEIEDIFAQEDFYKDIKLYENSIDVINNLKKNHQVKFISIGTPNNVINKIKTTTSLFNDVSQIMLIKNSSMFGKEDIDMRYSVLIDDHSKNLLSSNATFKILFEPYENRMEYNKNWKGLVAKNWIEVEEIINKIEGGK